MQAHGQFTLWREQQVILAHIRGQCNEDMAIAFSEEFKQVAAPLLDTPWAHIVYLDDWELATPEVEGIIQNLVAWLIAHGLTRTAQVYSPHMLKRYQLDRMITQKTDTFERQVFSDERAAFAWLSQEGFAVDTPSLQKTGSTS